MNNNCQCSRCRRQFDDCESKDPQIVKECGSYEPPLDNSKLFSHWYNFKGRIGRLEFGITIVGCLLGYFISILLGGRFFEWMEVSSESSYIIMHIVCMIIPGYIMIAASIKRAHDTGKDVNKVITPILIMGVLLFIRGGKFIVFFIALTFTLLSLIFYKSVDGINEHGSNPLMPYKSQQNNI